MMRKRILIFLGLIALLGCQKPSPEQEVSTAISSQVIAKQDTEQALRPDDAGASASISDEIALSRRNAITRAVDRISPAVVGINVTSLRRVYSNNPFANDPFFRNFFEDLPYTTQVKSLGSGFLVSVDGKILTNHHVINEANEIIVTMVDGSHQNARVIGQDRITDIALLKIDGNDFPFVEFGNSDEVIIGEWAIALGNPFGLFELNAKPTVTVGVISAKGQNFGRQEDRRVYQNMLQTDASINQGNSGGPLANALGQVIGINTFIFSGNSGGSIGLGFAIPINKVKGVLRELEDNGQVNRRYYTGLEVQNLTSFLARYLQLPSARGVIITLVEDGSPADRANLRAGDVILMVNGEAIRNSLDIKTIIESSDLRAGDKMGLRIYRNGREYDVQVRLENPPN